MLRPSFNVPAVLILAMPLFAQEKPAEPAKASADDVKKQKAAAAENIEKAKLTKVESAETDHLLVYSTLGAEKTKALAAAGEKAYEAAFKALKYEEKDTLWTGKLAVYFLPERKDFTAFVRLVEQRKPEPDETQVVSVRGAEPYILAGVATGSKLTDGGAADEVASAVAVAVLKQRAGATTGTFSLPGWLSTGFAKAVVYRSEGNKAKLAAHRTKVSGLFVKAKLSQFAAAGLWGEGYGKDTDTLAVSLVEFLAFGPPADKFTKLLQGYRPSDDARMTTTLTALTAIDFTPETLDAAWKKWVLGGR